MLLLAEFPMRENIYLKTLNCADWLKNVNHMLKLRVSTKVLTLTLNSRQRKGGI